MLLRRSQASPYRRHLRLATKRYDTAWPVRGRAPTMSPEVIPFAKTVEGGRRDNSNQLDEAGEAILQLLGKAADITEQSSQQAFETARRLSQQLRAAEDRIAHVQADVDTYRQKAERAEQWLHTVYTEIEDRFLKQDNPRRARR